MTHPETAENDDNAGERNIKPSNPRRHSAVLDSGADLFKGPSVVSYLKPRNSDTDTAFS